MTIGYERKSRKKQKTDLQSDSLKIEECEMVFTDTWTGTNRDRPEFEKMMAMLRKGDKVVVWKLDRLGRSLKDLISIINEFKDKGIDFKCQFLNIDTSTPSGMLFFHILGAMAEFEVALIHERTQAGLEAARSRGRIGGRPKGISKEALQKAKIAKTLYDAKQMSVTEIMSSLGYKSKATFYSHIKQLKNGKAEN